MPLTQDLISYWKLDQASGTRVDSHGSGSNDLTDNNTVGSATGKINDAASFIRNNEEYLSGASTVLQDPDGDFTITGWIKPTVVSGQIYVPISKDQSGSRTFAVFVEESNLKAFISKSGSFPVLIVPTTLSADTWYFFSFWHDSTANEIGLALNAGTPDTEAHSTGYDVGSGFLAIGQNFGTNYFDGLVDEVGLWERVLTSEEITDLYNGGAGLSYDEFGGGNIYNETMSGGVVVGGVAQPTIIYQPVASGGVWCNGTSAPHIIYLPQVTGGGLCGGSATKNTIYGPSTSGGAWCNGTAVGDSHTFNETMQGGAIVGGFAFSPTRYSDMIEPIIRDLIKDCCETVTCTQPTENGPVPLLLYTIVSAQHDLSLNGPTGLVTFILQLDAWAVTLREVLTILDCAHTQLNGYMTTPIELTTHTGQFTDLQELGYHGSHVFEVIASF